MASSLHFIVVLCLTSGLWTGSNANCEDSCDDTCKTCPSGWTQFEDHCYMYHHAQKDWADAEVACITVGGNLASIPNEEVYEFLRRIINRATDKNDRTWVGGYDSAKDGVWLWTDGTEFDLDTWGPTKSKSVNKIEHCLEINFNELTYTNNNECTSKSSFVCGKRM